ncbi:hypothetical protein Baya_11586 [Bagarius yarrelli]|uniref:Uncharacterized protein n=1 Tax=Bagarius yarrelli TaxID=175774 RepID=A0A556UZQ8_BAGYA|nr:hypothetical protein Baya_11586 [Bagarius yarrelli]
MAVVGMGMGMMGMAVVGMGMGDGGDGCDGDGDGDAGGDGGDGDGDGDDGDGCGGDGDGDGLVMGMDVELCVLCPVCREPLSYDANALLSSPLPEFPQASSDSSATPCTDALDPPIPAQSLSPPPLSECSDQNPLPPPVENKSNLPHHPAPHGRRQQPEFRGGRRARGGGHAAHMVPPPVLENLARLSVSSAENSRNFEAQLGDGHSAQLRQAFGDEHVRTDHQETPGAKHEHATSDITETGAKERGTRQEHERGRRYGPRRPPYSHFQERSTQWDNGGNIHYYRGARGHRAGPHRGTWKRSRQRTENELRKEGVL